MSRVDTRRGCVWIEGKTLSGCVLRVQAIAFEASGSENAHPSSRFGSELSLAAAKPPHPKSLSPMGRGTLLEATEAKARVSRKTSRI